MSASRTETERFVDGVRSALARIDEDRYQDQLDILLLGGTVPAAPIPQPDPGCSDCWGYGRVCPCHGVCAAHDSPGYAIGDPNSWRTAHLSRSNTDTCDCVKKARRRV